MPDRASDRRLRNGARERDAAAVAERFHAALERGDGRAACDDAGKEAGEIILQAGFSWAEDDEAALEGARVWKSTQIDDYFTDDWHDPKAMYERAEREISDDQFRESYIVSSDPEHHVERIREIERLGATVVCLQNGSGAAPEQALDVYGKSVLPALTG